MARHRWEDLQAVQTGASPRKKGFPPKGLKKYSKYWCFALASPRIWAPSVPCGGRSFRMGFPEGGLRDVLELKLACPLCVAV